MPVFRRALFPMFLSMCLTACGGDDDDSHAPAPVPAPSATLTLSSPTLRTIAGGTAIPITANLSSNGTVRWQLATGVPGSLSADSGGAVSYRPPGALAAPVTVAVTASGDGASATLTMLVTPDPGAPGMFLVAGSGEPATVDGVGSAASFTWIYGLAPDGAGNIYVMEYFPSYLNPGQTPQLRKIAPDGAVTTLGGNVNGMAVWFGRSDSQNNVGRLTAVRGFTADRAGNLYVATGLGTGQYGEVPGVRAAIFKIRQTGTIGVLAGAEADLRHVRPARSVDGTGTDASFLFPNLRGIDYAGNLYVDDASTLPNLGLPLVTTPRKVTPDGVVTSLQSLPTGLNADMNGNTYHYDHATRTIVRTSPQGVTSKEADAPYCDDLQIPEVCVRTIVPLDGASYLVASAFRVVRMVVRH